MITYFGFSIKKLLLFRIKIALSVLRYYIKYQIPERKAISQTKKLKGIHRNKKVFVFGNGPSMNKLDLQKIKGYQEQGYHLITVNSFMYSQMAKIVKPDYCVFSDPLDFIKVSPDHPRAERARTGKIDKQKVIDQNIPIFVPIQFYKDNDYSNTYYFCDIENVFSNNVSNVFRPRGYNSRTGMKALAIACFLGYKEIYIHGMDYNSFKFLRVDKNNKVYGEVHHYYEDQNRPKYVIDKSKYGSAEALYFLHVSLKFHEKFKDFPIINLDPDGFLDVFPKQHSLDVYK